MRTRAKVYALINIALAAAAIAIAAFGIRLHAQYATISIIALMGVAFLFNIYGWIVTDRDISKASNATHRIVIDHIMNLRRPLQGLVGIQDLFAQDSSPDEAKEYFEIADFCARHLIHQLDRLQFFSELAQDTLQARPQRTNVKSIVQGAIATALEQGNNRDVAISEHWEGSGHSEIMADGRLVTKALAEIIDNAARFGGGYRVVLHISFNSSDKNQIVFTVSDYGPGLSSEQMSNLMKLGRMPKKISWRNERQGLGFFLIQQLSRVLGAQFNVESKTGSGARFTLTVPFAPIQNQELELEEHFENSSRIKTHRRPLSALVVDDDAITAKVVATILTALDISATNVSNGNDAITLAQKNCYDVIFMDIEMPGMDGWQTSKIILNELALHNKPQIVALTSYCRQQDYDKARALGLFDLIAKPAHLEDLKRILERIYEARELHGTTAETNPETIEKIKSEPVEADFGRLKRQATTSTPLLNLIDLSNQFGGNFVMCRNVLVNAAAVFSVEADHIAAAISNGNLKELALAIHKMQGEFAIIMCSDGVNLCQNLTSAIHRGDWNAIHLKFNELAELVEQLLSEIDSSISSVAAA